MKRFMRHRTLSKNGGIKPDFSSLINHLSSIFHKNKNINDFSHSDFSELTRPVIWAHIDSSAGLEILYPIIKLFAKEGKYTILVTYSCLLSAESDWLNAYDGIDHLCPLLVDSVANAESFMAWAQPSVALFSVSSYSSNYLSQLKKRNIPTFLIAPKIAKGAPFLQGQGASYRETLQTFTHIFVFDHPSKVFLDQLGVSHVTVCAYPPVAMHGQKRNQEGRRDSIIERFIAQEKFIFIGGNIDTNKDLKLVARLANTHPALKCILAPHTISEEHLNQIKYELEGCTRLYSECDEHTNFDKVQTLVIDFLADLSQIYRYGSCAYIGGGETSYLHNLMEATANGLPTSFGPKIKNSPLPAYLIQQGVSQIVRTPKDLCQWEKNLESNPILVHRISSDAIRLVEGSLETAHSIYTSINSYL